MKYKAIPGTFADCPDCALYGMCTKMDLSELWVFLSENNLPDCGTEDVIFDIDDNDDL